MCTACDGRIMHSAQYCKPASLHHLSTILTCGSRASHQLWTECSPALLEQAEGGAQASLKKQIITFASLRQSLLASWRPLKLKRTSKLFFVVQGMLLRIALHAATWQRLSDITDQHLAYGNSRHPQIYRTDGGQMCSLSSLLPCGPPLLLVCCLTLVQTLSSVFVPPGVKPV